MSGIRLRQVQGVTESYEETPMQSRLGAESRAAALIRRPARLFGARSSPSPSDGSRGERGQRGERSGRGEAEHRPGLAWLTGGARRAGRALGRRRAAERVALEHLAFLDDAGVVLSTSLDPDLVADLIASLAVPRLGAGSVVFLREGEEIRLAALVHQNPSVQALLRTMAADKPATLTDPYPPGSVIRAAETWYLPRIDRRLAARMLPDPAMRRRFLEVVSGPVVSVPLGVGGRVLGALIVFRSDGQIPTGDITLTEQLARRAALALDNAERYQRQRDSALTLQRSLLLAHPPAVPGVEIAMEYRPGTAGTEVGGDLYDAIPLPGGRLGVAIGDVMGHGLRAAALMGQLRAALRAYALEGWGPAEVLARLDRVVELLPGLQLATCLYLVYDPETHRAVVANAGHLPPLLVSPDEEPDYLLLDPGLPLGVGEGGVYSESAFTLLPGSALVLFTDGLVEARGRTLSDGLDRLRDGLTESLRGPSGSGRPGHQQLGRGEPAPGWEGPAGQAPCRPGPGAGPGAVAAPSHGYARDLLDRCLTAAALPARTDDDTALLVMTTQRARPPLLELQLPAEAGSAGRAREALGRALTGSAGAGTGAGTGAGRGVALVPGPGAVDDAVLLVSEVVTNAVKHARSDLVLRAELGAGSLRVSVEDRAGEDLPAHRVGSDDDSGWGLTVIDSLARDWGVETTGDGKIVWFDLAVPEPVP